MADPFALKGVDALLEKFKIIDDDMRLKGGRFALRKAAQVIRNKARDNARRINDPATAENISKNIAERFNSRLAKRSNGALLSFRVGVLGGAAQYANTKKNVRSGKAGKSYQTLGSKDNPGGDTWYWRLVEFGTEHSAAQPFMVPAAVESSQQAADEFIVQYGKALDRALRRAKK